MEIFHDDFHSIVLDGLSIILNNIVNNLTDYSS